MVNGNPNEFVDTAYSGQEIFFVFDAKKYMFQGYMENGTCHMEIQQHEPWCMDTFWATEGRSMQECLECFLSAQIFKGKSFWDAEKDIEWVDE